MTIKHRIEKGTLYVILSGELDECTSNFVRQKLDAILEGKNFQQLIFDFSELEFMDSTGIGVLIGRYKKLKQDQIPIYIYNPSAQIEKIFKMSGLYEIMPKIA